MADTAIFDVDGTLSWSGTRAGRVMTDLLTMRDADAAAAARVARRPTSGPTSGTPQGPAAHQPGG
jgi:hypothetical protein